MLISDRTNVNMFIAAIEAVGATTPKAVLDAHDTTQRVIAAAQALGPGRGAVAVSVTDALFDGRDPASDPHVLKLVAAEQVSQPGIIDQIETIAAERFREVCLAQRDPIVHAWRKPFDAAAADLTAAFKTIGPIPLEDTTAVMQQGGDVAASWAKAQNASRTIDTIRSGWLSFVSFTHTVQPNRDHHVLLFADVPGRQWKDEGLHGRKLKPWEYLLAGLTLSLPTVAEYRVRVENVNRAMTEVETVIDRERSAVAGREIRVPGR